MNKTILIIEDEQLLLNILKMKFEKLGFIVEGAIDAREAFSLLQNKEVHLILLDLLLPGIDGYAILKKLKGDEKLKRIPVIVVSNLGGVEESNKAKNLGALDFIIKAEHSPESIAERVREALSPATR